jgi:hypothetical protein
MNECPKIAIASDAWFPQVNGVVRTLNATLNICARAMVEMITPDRFLTLPMPGYARSVWPSPRFNARRMLDEYRPDIVHIATEGPIGWARAVGAVRAACLYQRLSHAFSRISGAAFGVVGGMVLAGDAALSWCLAGDHGRHAQP